MIRIDKGENLLVKGKSQIRARAVREKGKGAWHGRRKIKEGGQRKMGKVSESREEGDKISEGVWQVRKSIVRDKDKEMKSKEGEAGKIENAGGKGGNGGSEVYKGGSLASKGENREVERVRERKKR